MVEDGNRIGKMLAESGMVTQRQLEHALRVQQSTGESIEKILLKLEYVAEEELIEILTERLGIGRVDFNAVLISSEAAALIPGSMAERYKVIPIHKKDRTVTLAMADPTNFYAIDDVRLVSGYEVVPVIATEREIMQAISRVYGIGDLIEKAVDRLQFEKSHQEMSLQAADDAPVITIVNNLFHQAVRDRASDIHIEPQEKYLRVRFRIDGMLREISSFPINIHAVILSRIKIMSNMDIAEKRIPQDGHFQITENGRTIDIRVSTLPTIFGEKVVMRILDKKEILLDLNKLGFSTDNLLRYRKLFSQAYGMLLVTGPTGSGKTTTLYSTLAELYTPEKNIITIEDPVEYWLEGINQVQVNHKAGLSFASGLRAILRQDPNIVMVGEIRDRETADMAVRAALTGQLVLSSLHTNNAPSAITRLVDMGIEPFLVAAAVIGVISQRLVRLVCPACSTAYFPAVDSPEREMFPAAHSLRQGTGCARCGNTGYWGRMAIHEIMLLSPQLRRHISERLSLDEIKAVAVSEGMITMQEDGIAKAINGLTTASEVVRVAYANV
ncbi:hypothetical protein P22_0144 [Propionispora sp. 2/2-37]|uniref:GspE/PulE family protein n=1 Tax=Propionispora sp. 2/2-37 TaxID=1677858 RepID=UPI0006C5BCC1|nr:GspE/PulE family protein [Propionispora sp. 2/2-37]CUH94082.1 hypothetical protein P22_0144 [Propionispora sp. 2/2-37]